MKFSYGLCLCLLLLAVVVNFSASAPQKKYNFIPAKCVVQATDKNIGGPLSICTFPPSHSAVPQEDIDAVIQHIQTLKLD